MSRTFLTRSASLSRSRKQLSVDFVPFSWALFVLAVFHFSVWSLGVACPGVTNYFDAHTSSLKTCDQSGQPASVQDLAAAQQQAQEAIRESQQALRLIREREAKHTHGAGASLQVEEVNSETSILATQLASLVLLTTFVGASQGSKQAAAAAVYPASFVASVCV